MPLPVTVALIVLVVMVLIGGIAYLIDENEERLESGSGDRNRRA